MNILTDIAYCLKLSLSWCITLLLLLLAVRQGWYLNFVFMYLHLWIYIRASVFVYLYLYICVCAFLSATAQAVRCGFVGPCCLHIFNIHHNIFQIHQSIHFSNQLTYITIHSNIANAFHQSMDKCKQCASIRNLSKRNVCCKIYASA